jgi:hypothetical protein
MPFAITMRLKLLAFVVALGIGETLAMSALAQTESLGAIKNEFGIKVDRNQISISGLSSGGWLAVQYHIAHSHQIMGIGILAGGPYHCAGSTSFTCSYTPYALLPYDSCQAMYVCSRTAAEASFWGFYIGPPDFQYSVTSARQEAEQGTVDSLSGLKNDRVWMFTGGREDRFPHDRLVPHEVVSELKKFYEALFALPEVDNPKQDIEMVDSVQVEHAMVTDSPGPDECDRFGPPYIDDCSYPAAEKLLEFIYPQRPKVSEPSSTGNLVAFDQRFVSSDPRSGMNDRGRLYIPGACRNGAQCPLHVALHGCSQDEQTIDQLSEDRRRYFYRDGGYNAWAEQHGVIILYPQAAKSAANPYGCWDWWGYSGADYYLKSGKQISAINAMVECLTEDSACP